MTLYVHYPTLVIRLHTSSHLRLSVVQPSDLDPLHSAARSDTPSEVQLFGLCFARTAVFWLWCLYMCISSLPFISPLSLGGRDVVVNATTLHTDHIHITYRLHTDRVQIIYRSHTDHILCTRLTRFSLSLSLFCFAVSFRCHSLSVCLASSACDDSAAMILAAQSALRLSALCLSGLACLLPAAVRSFLSFVLVRCSWFFFSSWLLESDLTDSSFLFLITQQWVL